MNSTQYGKDNSELNNNKTMAQRVWDNVRPGLIRGLIFVGAVTVIASLIQVFISPRVESRAADRVEQQKQFWRDYQHKINVNTVRSSETPVAAK